MQQFEQIPVHTYTEQAYHNYAMYVILDRAIPRLEDGLKPVQRRILYAMSELGLKASSKPKKSARTVGDVMGKFHPHGDTACYEAMVLMAQHFSFRYPLVSGQGNWGAIDDPKSFAAMRYTEANLSKYANILLKNLNSHTTEWGPNFDGTLKEPLVLPTTLPNILLNGASGIAVGIATDIPPHNLKEVGQACIALLKNPTLTPEELLEVLPGPDYPLGAEIINSKSELLQILKTGLGTIKQRATYTLNKNQICINSLPHQVSSSKAIQQIADLMIEKKLPMVKNLRDDSDEDAPVSIVLTVKHSTDIHEMMNILFTETDLEKNHKVNITYISPERKPLQSGILPLLQQWLVFSEETLLKQLRFQLEKAETRSHIIDGLLIIFNHLDEVIQIIRYDDDPQTKLMTRFSLSKEQAIAILETKLKHLAKLEVLSLEKEYSSLTKEMARLNKLLSSNRARKQHMIKTLEEEIKISGDERRSRIIEKQAAQRAAIPSTVPKEPVTIALSQKNWIRSLKGHDVEISNIGFKTGDQLALSTQGYSHWPTLLFDTQGTAYTLLTHELPSGRSQGDPITTRITPSADLSRHLINQDSETLVLLASDLGYGFITQVHNLVSRNKSGKKVMSLGQANIAGIIPMSQAHTHIALMSQQGRLLIITKDDVPQLPKGKGNKLIQIHKQDHGDGSDRLLAILPITLDAPLSIQSGKRTLSILTKDLLTYLANRGHRGLLLPRGFRRVSSIKQG